MISSKEKKYSRTQNEVKCVYSRVYILLCHSASRSPADKYSSKENCGSLDGIHDTFYVTRMISGGIAELRTEHLIQGIVIMPDSPIP